LRTRSWGSAEGRVTPRIRFNNAAAALPVVLAGQVIARLPEAYIRDERTTAASSRCFPGWRPAPLAVNVITPPGRRGRARVRVLIDFPAPASREGVGGRCGALTGRIDRIAATVKRRGRR
jgi:DNA-binding transcriptional LysR family regulator